MKKERKRTLSVSFSMIKHGPCAQFSCNFAKGPSPKERAKQIRGGKERKEVVIAEDHCGVGSSEGSVNSNKSQILFFLVTGAADVRRVKVRANCLQSECF